MIPIVTVFVDWGFQCYQLSLFEPFALSSSHFCSELKLCLIHLTLPLWSYSVRTDWQLSWPSSSNSNPVSTLSAAVGFVKLIADWHWYCFVFTQFYIISWTVSMHWHPPARCSVLSLIMIRLVCTAVALYMLQYTVLPMLFCNIRI